MKDLNQQMNIKKCDDPEYQRIDSNKPPHDKTNEVACAHSEDSDSPHLISLDCPHKESLGP